MDQEAVQDLIEFLIDWKTKHELGDFNVQVSSEHGDRFDGDFKDATEPALDPVDPRWN